MMMSEVKKQMYDMRHGSPYDRGSADKYYGRSYEPHYFKGATYDSDKVELANMTVEEIVAYTAGYEQQTETKDWGEQ
jgi:hypothetical protein